MKKVKLNQTELKMVVRLFMALGARKTWVANEADPTEVVRHTCYLELMYDSTQDDGDGEPPPPEIYKVQMTSTWVHTIIFERSSDHKMFNVDLVPGEGRTLFKVRGYAEGKKLLQDLLWHGQPCEAVDFTRFRDRQTNDEAHDELNDLPVVF